MWAVPLYGLKKEAYFATIAAFAYVKLRMSLLVIRTWYELFRFKA